MNPQASPSPEQLPAVPMAEIPQVPEKTAPAPAPIVPVRAAPPIVSAAGATTPVAQPIDSSVTPTASTSNPAIADDVDVIEKEWVDKAESIIAGTVGDPHAEEEQIEDLTIDYMKKRYGKDVAKSGDQPTA